MIFAMIVPFAEVVLHTWVDLIKPEYQGSKLVSGRAIEVKNGNARLFRTLKKIVVFGIPAATLISCIIFFAAGFILLNI